MKQLWAPWRMEYILGPKQEGCVLCVEPQATGESGLEDDRRRLVVYRGTLVCVMLNKYPYASGHLMILPYRHVGDLTELTPEEAAELMAVTQLVCRVLRAASRPEGLNVGLNLGQAAGAGIRDHLHMHVVPRWNGDSAFIAVLDEVRVIPEHLEATWRKLRPLFAQLAMEPN